MKMKTTWTMLVCAWATIAAGQDRPFLGVWTNTVNQGRVTVSVTLDFQTNGSVIVYDTAFSNRPYAVSYTGRYEVIGNDIVFYGESGHGFSPHQGDHRETTNHLIYSAEKDLLANKGDHDFRHPLRRLNRKASNKASEAIAPQGGAQPQR